MRLTAQAEPAARLTAPWLALLRLLGVGARAGWLQAPPSLALGPEKRWVQVMDVKDRLEGHARVDKQVCYEYAARV